MTTNPRRLLLTLGLVTCALVASWAVGTLCLGRTTQSQPLPSPNGYDDLVRAGQLVTRRFDSPNDLDHDTLRALVATNAEALRLLRVGLTRHCMVPTDALIANFANVSGDLIGLKSLARVLSAEGRLAEMENRSDDAARSYVDAIRLGAEMSHGGFIMNRMVGIACEGVGSIPLVRLLPQLTCEQMQPLVAQLEQIDIGTEPWGQILKNENRFALAQLGNYPNPFKFALGLWQTRALRRASEERHALAAAHLRLFTAELALRCYRCGQGSAPATLQQLLPKYLQEMPSDPFSSHPLVYRPTATNWLLYSVGPDLVDDGGKPIGRAMDHLIGFEHESDGGQKNKGDLLYDSPW